MMLSRLEVFAKHLSHVKSFDGLRFVTEQLQKIYHADHFTYQSINCAGEPYGALTYSQDWVKRYLAKDYGRIDPVVLGCYQRFHPVDWKDLDWSGKAAQNFRREACAAGMGNQGFSVPIRGPIGQFALFSVNHQCSDSDWAKFTQAHVQDLILIAHYMNKKALDLEQGADVTNDRPLSPRELDVLTLLGMGQSRALAAAKLSISEHTLRVYIESARLKLGAANTIHAVALAMSQGRIFL